MRDITLCHPRLQRLAGAWMKACVTQGIAVTIGETFRTVAEQDALYAQGRTKPGKKVTNAPGSSYSSQHQWGIAFDFYLIMDIDGDGSTSDDAFNDRTGMFKKAAEIAKGLGLAWGGDWKSLEDKPHLYLPDWGSTPTALIQKYGTPEEFMATWVPEQVKTGWKQEDGGWRFYFRDGSGKWYYLDDTGRMATEPVVLTPDQDGALQYPGLRQ